MGSQAVSESMALDEMIFKYITPLAHGDPKVQDPWPVENTCVPSLDPREEMLAVPAVLSWN